MKQHYCEYRDCTARLDSFSGIVTGLCDRHYKMLDKHHHFAVICWQCNHIHSLEASPVQAGEKLIKDKYIFTKTCPACSESEGNEWMNNPKADELSEVTLGPGLTLYPSKQGLIADQMGKNSLLNPHRSIKATEDHFTCESDEIIGTIELSPDNMERIEKFRHWLK